ncbi:MAG: acyltransferase [Gemmataceae bacterium]|nr:acyltransferase [Gemmataceae bacterium]
MILGSSLARPFRLGLRGLAAVRHSPAPGGDRQRFAYIDALRGIAACWVLLYHLGFPLLPWLGPFRHVFERGWLGVDVFFVLSGFVIAYNLRDAAVTPSYIGRFALRRSLRLDPPYWTMIFLTYAIILLRHGTFAERTGTADAVVLATNLCYANKFAGCPIIVSVGWTLCLEVQFYLVFVLLTGLAQRIGRTGLRETPARLFVFLPLALLSIGNVCGLVPCPIAGLFLPSWYAFFLGVIAAWFVFGRVSAGWLIGAVATAGGLLLHQWDTRIFVALLTASSIVAVARLGRLHDLLGGAVFQYLGRISYSLYLIHFLIGELVRDWGAPFTERLPQPWGDALLVLASIVASFGAAHLLHVLVELPSVRLSKCILLRTARTDPRMPA